MRARGCLDPWDGGDDEGYASIETSTEIPGFAGAEQMGLRVSAAGLCLASASPATQHRWEKCRQGQPAVRSAGRMEARAPGGAITSSFPKGELSDVYFRAR